MGIFSGDSTVAEKFEAKLESNPTYPFTKEVDENGDVVYRLRIRYKSFYVALLLAVASVVTIITIVLLEQTSEYYFIFPVSMLLVALFGIYTYKDVREYALYDKTKTYTFSLSFLNSTTTVYRGRYHNVYIRLMKTIGGGRTYYYLAFNGYRVDKQILTDADRSFKGLQHVGRELARNLDLNYFAEQNISRHHVIRHYKPE